MKLSQPLKTFFVAVTLFVGVVFMRSQLESQDVEPLPADEFVPTEVRVARETIKTTVVEPNDDWLSSPAEESPSVEQPTELLLPSVQ